MHPDDPWTVERFVSEIPVRALPKPSIVDYLDKLEAVIRALDIDAVSDGERGILYRGDDVAPADQPLVAAISTLVARRFGYDTVLPETPPTSTGDEPRQ